MWRWGFFVWRAWLVGKYAVPALLLLWVIHTAQGFSPLFWSAAVVFGCVGLGLWLGVAELRDREFGKIGKDKIR
ncbi:hypothetical protein FB384_001362 [Prauserella sediminis]|uniref:Uncharacterized protein n=1 Tax=Prauserella sediminis TaxID=577680 RepID=A0A839XNN9_9PSEU|nr:hypothetical protein [Prauserella sediminis]MBB3662458.1 hypothetical protein [Prauserella sediminis]